MKKNINYLRKLKMEYYSFMMAMCAENVDEARIEHGDGSVEHINWILEYNKYSDKYAKTLEKAV